MTASRLPPISRDDWILLVHYYFTKPEATHTDSHPDCQDFARLLRRTPATVDSSLRNIKAYHDGGAGRGHGASTMRIVVDEFKNDLPALAAAARGALTRLKSQPVV